MRRVPRFPTLILGTCLPLLLLASPQAPLLGLGPGREAPAGPGARRSRSRPQLGLGGARVARTFSRLRHGSARPRQQRLGAGRALQPSPNTSWTCPLWSTSSTIFRFLWSATRLAASSPCCTPAFIRTACAKPSPSKAWGCRPRIRVHKPAPERMRDWIEGVRKTERPRAAQLSQPGSRRRPHEGSQSASVR